MSNSNGPDNGRQSSSGPERPAKSISQRVKNAFSALGRFSPRRRSCSIQVQADPSSEDDPSVSDLEVEIYLSTNSSSTSTTSDDDLASPEPTEPILLNQDSEDVPPIAQLPAFPHTSPSSSQEIVLSHHAISSFSASASNTPPTPPPLPVLYPTNPRSYGAFKKDRAPQLPNGYRGVLARLPPGFQRTTPGGLVRQYAYDDIEDRMQGHGLRREFAVHEDAHPGLRSPFREEWWVYTHIRRVERGEDGGDSSDFDDGSSSSGSGADSSASRSRPRHVAPSPPSSRNRRPPTPGPSSSGRSHTVNDRDSQNPRAAARHHRQYTPYSPRQASPSYPSPSIYRSPNPGFMRSRVGGFRERGSPLAGSVDEDSDMDESDDELGATNEGAQLVGGPSQNPQPLIPHWLLRDTDRMFTTISEVEEPILREASPITLLGTIDDIDSARALPVFSAYSNPYPPPWSTTTAHHPPPRPHVVFFYPDIQHPDHSSIMLKDLESNDDLPFSDLTLPPIRTDTSAGAGPSQERLPSLFYPDVPKLSEYHHVPRRVLNRICPLPEPYISRGKDSGPPNYVLDRIPPSQVSYPPPPAPLPSYPPSPPPRFYNSASRNFIVSGGALGLTGCRRRRFEEDELEPLPCHEREDYLISEQRPAKRQKFEHIPVEKRVEGGLVFVSEQPFDVVGSISSAAGPSGPSLASRPAPSHSVSSVAGPSRRLLPSQRSSPYPPPSSSESTPLRRSARISAAKAKEGGANREDDEVDGEDVIPKRKGKGKRKGLSRGTIE